jgi:hypothetical protein
MLASRGVALDTKFISRYQVPLIAAGSFGTRASRNWSGVGLQQRSTRVDLRIPIRRQRAGSDVESAEK